MQRIIYIGILMILTTISAMSQSDEVTIPFDDPSAEKKLKIDLFQGDITITGTDRKDVLVKYEVTKEDEEPDNEGSDHQGLKKISGSNLDLEMSSAGNTAVIESHNWNQNIIFTIEVPSNTNLNVQKNIGGQVNVENLNGSINIENNIGDVVAKNMGGVVNASTNAGNVEVHFSSIPDSKNMMFTSTTGNVDLSLPAAFAADLKLKTDMGDIYSDLEIVIDDNAEKATTESKDGTFKYFNSHWTNASLNGGGPGITLRTKLGNIYLREK